MGFTHLHVHTEYSLLDGSNKSKEYVARVKELGMDSAAITDHGVMYGCIDFYRAAKDADFMALTLLRYSWVSKESDSNSIMATAMLEQ